MKKIKKVILKHLEYLWNFYNEKSTIIESWENPRWIEHLLEFLLILYLVFRVPFLITMIWILVKITIG